VRLTEVLPGMVETDFSLERFAGDSERAANVYQGLTPLTARDVAEVIGFEQAGTREPRPDRDQAAGPGVGDAGTPAGLTEPRRLGRGDHALADSCCQSAQGIAQS